MRAAGEPGSGDTGPGKTFAAHAKAEARNFAVMFLYLWVLFGLFSLHEAVVLREYQLNVVSQSVALVNALIFAKVMLLGDYFGLGRGRPDRPILPAALLDSVLFGALFLAIHLVERVAVGLVAHESLRASVPAIGGGGFVGLVCVSLILVVSLVPFFLFRGIARELGAIRMRALLLGRP